MKRTITLLVLFAMLLSLWACGGETAPTEPSQTQTEPTVNTEAPEKPALPTVDPSGAAITVPEDIQSIVVLAPSLAETIVALGFGDKIVGYDLNSVGLAGLPEDVPTFDTVNPDVEQLVAIAPDVLFVSSLSL